MFVRLTYQNTKALLGLRDTILSQHSNYFSEAEIFAFSKVQAIHNAQEIAYTEKKAEIKKAGESKHGK